MSPAANPEVSFNARKVDVEPEAARFTAVAPFAPDPFSTAPAAGARRFMCCEPAESAIVSLLQVLKRRDTLASTISFTWYCVVPGEPTTRGAVLLNDLRLKSSIHPRSIQGAGGEDSANWPFTEGSK